MASNLKFPTYSSTSDDGLCSEQEGVLAGQGRAVVVNVKGDVPLLRRR